MSIIGPRPALWNQYDLIEEIDKYGANDVPVGLTGWAQINGRDELEIDVKAKLDGEYVEKIGFLMDVRCFLGTIFSVLEVMVLLKEGLGLRLPAAQQAQRKKMVCPNFSKGNIQNTVHLIEVTK